MRKKIALCGEICWKELWSKGSSLRGWVAAGGKFSEDMGNCSVKKKNMEQAQKEFELPGALGTERVKEESLSHQGWWRVCTAGVALTCIPLKHLVSSHMLHVSAQQWVRQRGAQFDFCVEQVQKEAEVRRRALENQSSHHTISSVGAECVNSLGLP